MIGRLSGGARTLLVLGFVLAAVPVLRMASLVGEGTHMQYNDYWPMVATVFEPDGGLDLGGLFEFRNEHPVVVAKTMYWLNHQLASGSNIVLGYVIVAVAGLQVLVIAGMARRTPLSPGQKVALVVTGSALLFAPFGAWSFVKSMSGAAWLTANLFAVTAIWLRSRNSRFAPLPLGVLATMSYGTGLVVWPALLLTGWVRDKRLRPQWPTALAATASVAWFLTNFLDTRSSDNARSSGLTVLRQACQIIGSILLPTSGAGAAWLGGGAAVGVIVLSVMAVRRHGPTVAPWLGLGAMGLGSALLIGFGRIERMPGNIVQSRYSSPAALVWIALLALLICCVPRRVFAVVPLAVVTVVASASGGASVDDLRETASRQDLLAVAMHLDLADGSTRWSHFQPFEPVTGLLRTIGHHPFDERWHADCGLLGEVLDPNRIEVVPPMSGGVVTKVVRPAEKAPGGTEYVGWVAATRGIDCILVIDDDHRVVGAGAHGYGTVRRNRSPFRALAPAQASGGTLVVRYHGDDHFRLLEDQVATGPAG